MSIGFGVTLAFSPYLVIELLSRPVVPSLADQWPALAMLIVFPSTLLWSSVAEGLMARGRTVAVCCGLVWPFLTLFIGGYINRSLHLDLSLQPHLRMWFVLLPLCVLAGLLMHHMVNAPGCRITPPLTATQPELTRPWVACGMSLIPSFGQIYNGEIWKAGVFLIIELAGGTFLIKFLALRLPFDPPYNVVVPALSMLLLHSLIMFEAYYTALMHPRPVRYPWNEHFFAFFALTFGIVLIAKPLLAGISDRYYAVPARIFSDAMEPNLLKGDRFLVDRSAYTTTVMPQRGDVVLLESDDGFYYRRVVAIASDRISLCDRYLTVNDSTQYSSPDTLQGAIPETIEIPKGTVFVWADNATSSSAAHAVGIIPVQQIMGKSSIIFWSWVENSFQPDWERFGLRLNENTFPTPTSTSP